MSTDDDDGGLAALESSASRLGIALAKRHAEIVDRSIAAMPPVPVSGDPVVTRLAALSTWSSYIGHIVAHMGKAVGLQPGEIAQHVTEAVLQHGGSERAN